MTLGVGCRYTWPWQLGDVEVVRCEEWATGGQQPTVAVMTVGKNPLATFTVGLLVLGRF